MRSDTFIADQNIGVADHCINDETDKIAVSLAHFYFKVNSWELGRSAVCFWHNQYRTETPPISRKNHQMFIVIAHATAHHTWFSFTYLQTRCAAICSAKFHDSEYHQGQNHLTKHRIQRQLNTNRRQTGLNYKQCDKKRTCVLDFIAYSTKNANVRFSTTFNVGSGPEFGPFTSCTNYLSTRSDHPKTVSSEIVTTTAD